MFLKTNLKINIDLNDENIVISPTISTDNLSDINSIYMFLYGGVFFVI